MSNGMESPKRPVNLSPALQFAILFSALFVFYYQLTFFCLAKYRVTATEADLSAFALAATILTGFVAEKLAKKWNL
jgi:hypothetical protein